jgi:SNF2 family DNA or RNA helicase
MPSLTDLHEYQRDAVDYLIDNPAAMLVLDMGLGKTVITLTAVQRLLDAYEATKVLVVAPKRVAVNTWPTEIDAWDHVSAGYSVLCGSKKQREAACKSGEPIHIINVDNLVWLIEHWGKAWPYDMLVIDESSLFKSYSTRRFKTLKRRMQLIDRVVLLTGTPAPNSLMDLWPQIFLLDGGERLFRTISGYRDHYFQKDYNGFSWSLREGAEKDIYQRVEDLCLRMDAADYLETPDRVDVTVPVVLPAKAMKQYEELEKHSLLELAEGEVVALNAAVLVGKLLQCANGALYTDEDGAWEHLHDAKLDALADILETSAGQPVLVAYNFQHDLQRLRARFPEARVLDADPATVDQWNAGEIPLLLAHPQSAGHGLNLQHGGSILVWFSLTWSLELYLQFNARLHRQGQKRVTVVHHLIAKDTVDETVVEALARKDAGQNDLFDALRARAKEVLG